MKKVGNLVKKLNKIKSNNSTSVQYLGDSDKEIENLDGGEFKPSKELENLLIKTD